MGKSKKRIFNKHADFKGTTLSRNKIIEQIIGDIKNNKIEKETKKFISLFGITHEELTEAGATLEELSILNSHLK